MSSGRIAAGRGRTVRAIGALTVLSACFGAVAFAATRPEHPNAGLAGSKPVGGVPEDKAGAPAANQAEALPRPRFIEYPEEVSSGAEPQFRFHVPPRRQRKGGPVPGSSEEPGSSRRFQCRLDNGGWRACTSPHRLSGLAAGGHSFAVRAFNRAGDPGPAISHTWRQAEPLLVPEQADPQPFSIELRGELEDLYPGFPAQSLPIVISNPNPVPIEVTTIAVAIAGEPPSCAAENFALTPSSASPEAPLVVPPSASVTLPTASISAPSIRMLNLSANQDACQGADLALAFNGEAHG